MTVRHKTGKPTGFRLSDEDKRDARKAARLESARLSLRAHRRVRVGWTTLVTRGGMSLVRAIIRRDARERMASQTPELVGVRD